MTDHEADKLIKRIAQGDIEALKVLYENMSGPVYFLALRLCRDPDTAEDLMQDTFVSIMRASKGYVSSEKAISWIFTIVRNKVYDWHKMNRPTVEVDENEDDDETASDSDPIEKLLDESSVSEILSPLNNKEREIVILRVLIGYTLTDIARELKISKGTVFWTYNNAMKKLRRSLKGETDHVQANESPDLIGDKKSDPR